MRFIEDLCPPALLYMIFLVIQLGLDASLAMWVTFVVKALFGVATVIVLDMFCGVELSVVSWFLVAAPFLITALGTAIAIGTNIDKRILEGFTTQTYYEREAKTDDLPASSNAIIQFKE